MRFNLHVAINTLHSMLLAHRKSQFSPFYYNTESAGTNFQLKTLLIAQLKSMGMEQAKCLQLHNIDI